MLPELLYEFRIDFLAFYSDPRINFHPTIFDFSAFDLDEHETDHFDPELKFEKFMCKINVSMTR